MSDYTVVQAGFGTNAEKGRCAAIGGIALGAGNECIRASEIHGKFNSAHEAYAVILEEVDEFWDEVKKKREARSPEKMRKELIQIAAMAIRTIYDLKLQPGR